jgi:hypothetical protein
MGRKNAKKKKNAGVGIDFKRAKQKVGKKLPKAKNVTVTAFKAQSISLPGQGTLTEERDGVPVSDRNLTLKVSWILLPHNDDALASRCSRLICEISRFHKCSLSLNALG